MLCSGVGQGAAFGVLGRAVRPTSEPVEHGTALPHGPATQHYGRRQFVPAHHSSDRSSRNAQTLGHRLHRCRHDGLGLDGSQQTLRELQQSGLLISGASPNGRLVEMIEIPGHPFFVGSQFHPEFKSRPLKPHPLFREFIRAAVKK